MNVRGILIEGHDGPEYLLGFHAQPSGTLAGAPTLSRRGADGTFQAFDDPREAPRVATAQLGPRGAHVIGGPDAVSRCGVLDRAPLVC
jgi:hypothetical protein